MKFGFVTCVQLGLSCMEAIYAAGGRLDLAITIPDHKARAKSGRIYLDEFCTRHGVPLLKVGHINDAAATVEIRRLGIDWLFIIGWSQIASAAVLGAPRLGVLGIHPTLLPEGRGRAAIPWAIIKRLPRTGVSLFKLDDGVDTGPIVARRIIPLSADTDATWLYNAVNVAHADLIREVLPRLMDGSVVPVPQDESLATVWPGRNPEDGRIDMLRSVEEAECLVRALARPYPGAFVQYVDGSRQTIWKARVAQGASRHPRLSFHDGELELLQIEPRDPC